MRSNGVFFYAVDFSSCLCGLIFLFRKPKYWLAFFVMLAICVPQLDDP